MGGSKRAEAQRAGGRADVLGVAVATSDAEAVVGTVRAWTRGEDVHFAVGVNAHVVNLAHRDREFARALEHSSLNYADGQSVVWAARWLGVPVAERVATTDLVWPLAGMAAEDGVPLFLYGGRPGVAERAARQLTLRHPALQVVGTSHGFLGPAEQPALVSRINDSGARLLFVGLGNPRQEQWVMDNRGALGGGAVLTCGGLLDWVAGDQPRPPAWVPRSGMEWAWRLVHEPRRLARRYLLGNPEFLGRLGLALVVRAGRRARAAR